MAKRWYSKDGHLLLQVAGKNGNKRNVTIRDARALDLVPSVTTILSILDKPGLEKWKLNEVAKACYNTNHGLHIDEYTIMALSNAFNESDIAKNFGSMVHDYILMYYSMQHVNIASDYASFISEVFKYLMKNEIYGISEELKVNDKFAGTIDLYNEEYVLDFKTQKGEKFFKYPEWGYQLAGYGKLLGKNFYEIDFYNIIISSTYPGLIEKVKWSSEEMERNYHIFDLMVNLFYALNKL